MCHDPLGLVPQIVHLVRHGQGYHNVAGEAEEDLYKSYDFLDAHLTAKGWEQVGLSRHQSCSDADAMAQLCHCLLVAIAVGLQRFRQDAHASLVTL